ncbi:helix-turn-helix domain-containing protein [Edaphovirga cremea]|uniref:helix-turn-helix domain-containing protein n=1 Tax=Edaphovirga cremea TaxID=2267246 RepID=UPI003989F903
MKVKGIPHAEVRAEALQNPEVMAAYLQAKKEAELYDLLQAMKARAGINSTQVAERLGISQPAVSRLEKNPTKASITTLERYAAACGTSLKISMA